MSDPVIPLSLGCMPTDRTYPFFIGEVSIPGFRITPEAMDEPAAIFRRMVQDKAFALSEMSLGQCFEQAAQADPPFVALPVFLSRSFRHSYIFVNRKSGITHPRQLAGRRIGVQHHGMSAAVWIRASLRQEFGVDFSRVHWIEGPVNELGKDQKVSGASRGKGLVIEQVHDRTLSDMLAKGEIDAMIGAWVPASFGVVPDVVRLFPDPRSAEKRFYTATRIFPIMHALVLRSDMHRAYPGLARQVYDAFVSAKQIMHARHHASGALSTMLPWLRENISEVETVFDSHDIWPYGLAANRPTLDAFVRGLIEDGALDAAPPLDQVFLPFD